MEEESQEVKGIDEVTRAKIFEVFANSSYDATTPALLADIYEKRFDKLSVLIISIPGATKIARRMKLAKKLGSGIKLIYTSCLQAGLRKPKYIEGADSVKVIFYFMPVPDRSISANEQILKLFARYDIVDSMIVANYLGVSRNTAIRKLRPLLINKKIYKISKGSTTKYSLPP